MKGHAYPEKWQRFVYQSQFKVDTGSAHILFLLQGIGSETMFEHMAVNSRFLYGRNTAVIHHRNA